MRPALHSTACLALTASLIVATPSFAQSAPTNAPGMIEEIVVTATKRGEQSLQDVPISITAFSASTLRDKGVDSFSDFAFQVPGLSFEDAGPGDKNFIIRGVNSTGTGVATVGQYIDEMLVTGDLRQPDLRLYDIERIEVLRGPQGTLYGSGSLSGTLRIVTNKPDSTAFDASVDVSGAATHGGGGDYEGSGMVNIPLVQDRLALRAVGYYRDFSGFIDNVRLGVDEVNAEDTYGGRVSLRYTPTENTTLTASAFYQETNLDGRNIFTTADGTLGDFNTDQFVRDPFDDDYDELAEVNIIEQASNFTPRAIVPARPRRVGVQVSYRY